MNELWGFIPKSFEEIPQTVSTKALSQRFELPAAESVVVYYSYYYKIFSFRSDQDNRPLQSPTVEHSLPRDIHVEEAWSPAFEKWLVTGRKLLSDALSKSTGSDLWASEEFRQLALILESDKMDAINLKARNAILAVLITMALLEELARSDVSINSLLQAVLANDSPDFKPGSELQVS